MSDEEEIWKTYPDYSFIEVSNLGRVRTKDRIAEDRNGRKFHIKRRVLKQHLTNRGYMQISFHTGGKQVNLSVHRMVATCYIPNPDNLPEINHIDNNPTNNRWDNLEWCTRKYNMVYREKCGKSAAEVLGHPVIAVNIEISEVFWFETQHEAARQLGVDVSSINKVVKGKQNKAKGYWFTCADSTAVEKTRSKFGDDIAEKVEKLMQET